MNLPKVLVVEDSPTDLELIVATLANTPCTLVTEAGGVLLPHEATAAPGAAALRRGGPRKASAHRQAAGSHQGATAEAIAFFLLHGGGNDLVLTAQHGLPRAVEDEATRGLLPAAGHITAISPPASLRRAEAGMSDSAAPPARGRVA